ncbi:hypothetical protein BJ170DRAFT_698589 [Xylariales sp. AK1849]|nr:hypothetical protein BJ170DRAFT_698589 [Xylariales sp. AK1849]
MLYDLPGPIAGRTRGQLARHSSSIPPEGQASSSQPARNAPVPIRTIQKRGCPTGPYQAEIPKPQSPFFRLPPELRNQIYELCDLKTCVEIHKSWSIQHNAEPAILQTCRQIRREACPIFYDEVVVRFGDMQEDEGWHHGSHSSHVRLLATTPYKTSEVRILSIEYDLRFRIADFLHCFRRLFRTSKDVERVELYVSPFWWDHHDYIAKCTQSFFTKWQDETYLNTVNFALQPLTRFLRQLPQLRHVVVRGDTWKGLLIDFFRRELPEHVVVADSFKAANSDGARLRMRDTWRVQDMTRPQAASRQLYSSRRRKVKYGSARPASTTARHSF